MSKKVPGIKKKKELIREVFIRILCGLIFIKSVRNSIRFAFLHIGIINTLQKIFIIKFTKQTKQKYYLSVVATVKNEGCYLQEWIEYYKIMGVEHFYIYDNESTDNTKEILQPYILNGDVTYHYFEGKNRQIEMYNEALEKYKIETKWLAPLDADEFVYPITHKTIADYLKQNKKYNQIVFNWLSYGNSGHKEKPQGLVLENYTHRGDTPCHETKAIVQSLNTIYLLIHKHSVWGLSKYEPVSEIYCKHFYGKSEEEYINKKLERGSQLTSYIYDMDTYKEYNQNTIYDPMPQEILEIIKSKIS